MVSIAALAAVRARLTNGYIWLQARQGQPNALPNGAHLLEELILKEYLPAIRQYRDRLTEPERHDLAMLYARKVAELHDDATFDAHINEYLVAEDIANPRLLQDLLDRVTFWAAPCR